MPATAQSLRAPITGLQPIDHNLMISLGVPWVRALSRANVRKPCQMVFTQHFLILAEPLTQPVIAYVFTFPTDIYLGVYSASSLVLGVQSVFVAQKQILTQLIIRRAKPSQKIDCLKLSLELQEVNRLMNSCVSGLWGILRAPPFTPVPAQSPSPVTPSIKAPCSVISYSLMLFYFSSLHILFSARIFFTQAILQLPALCPLAWNVV